MISTAASFRKISTSFGLIAMVLIGMATTGMTQPTLSYPSTGGGVRPTFNDDPHSAGPMVYYPDGTVRQGGLAFLGGLALGGLLLAPAAAAANRPQVVYVVPGAPAPAAVPVGAAAPVVYY